MRAFCLSLIVLGSLYYGSLAEEVLFVSSGAGSLYRVDVTSGTTTLVGHTGKQLNDIAFSPAGELYGLAQPDDIYWIDLSRIAPDLSITTEFVGSLDYEGSGLLRREVTSLEFGPDGRMYFATFDGIGFSGGLFTPPTGRLGFAELTPFFNRHIIGDIGYGNAGDLAFAPDVTLYMNSCMPTGFTLACSTTHNNQLVRVDPPLGEGTQLGSTGFRNIFGMDFVGTTLYGTTNAGELITINTATGQGTLVTRMNPFIAATGASATASFPPGDFDGNGVITTADYARWRSNFGRVVSGLGADGDGNGNGVVDAADYVLWRNRLSTPAPAFGSFAGIPEPPSLLISVAVVLFLTPLRTKRRGFFYRRQSSTLRRGVGLSVFC